MNEQMRSKVLGTLHWRSMPIARETVNKDERSFPMSFAAGANVSRWWGIEALSMDPAHIRLDRWKDNPAFLMDHDPADQRGIIEGGALENGILRGTVRLSKNPKGQELLTDIEDGIRTKTSVGYIVHGFRELKPEEMSDEQKQMALQEKLSVILVDDWEPIEGSSVAIPADPSVGYGRSITEYFPARSGQPAQTAVITSPTTPAGGSTMEKSAEVLEQERRQEIDEISTRFAERIYGGKAAMDTLKAAAIDTKIPAEQFRRTVFGRINDGLPLQQTPAQLGLSEKEIKSYSIQRVIQHQIEPGKFKADFELECSRAVADGLGRQPQGMFVPDDVLLAPRHIDRAKLADLQKRAGLTAAGATSGLTLVGTEHMPQSFIELMRAQELGPRLGVQYLSGLRESVSIPRQTGGSTWYWGAESFSITQSDMTLGAVTLSPKMGGAWTMYSRKLLIQSLPSVDMLITNDLTRVAALGGDKAIFHGSGTNQPTGIYLTSGIGSVAGAGMGWDGAVEFEGDVAGGNADVGSMAFVMNPSDRSILKSRPKEAGFPVYICENNEINGYPVLVSTQITAGYIFFGVFSQALLAEFGGTDILVNPYTGDQTGEVRVTIYRQVDVGVRVPAAFSVCSTFS